MKTAVPGLFVSILLAAVPAWAQLMPRNPAGVTLGHIHLAVRDVAAQKAFWIDMMGGKLVRNGALELIAFPGVYIMLRQSDTAAPPEGAVVDHLGFTVKDMPAAMARWKASNLKVTSTENPNDSFVWAPDGIRVEVHGDPGLPTPIQMHHLHFHGPDVSGMQAWYMTVLGGTPGKRACTACVSRPMLIDTVDVPGGNLSFSQAQERLAPTKGRALDHIGFDVKNLEAFAKNLEANGIKLDAPVRQGSAPNLKIAFLTDPWGTRIELTENLSPSGP